MPGPLYAEELTYRIRSCVFTVSSGLGPGFLERVYERALAIELKSAGLEVRPQYPVTIYYKGVSVGDYIADLMVEGQVLLELKACRTLAPEHKAQLLNYLRATEIKVGLLINFGTPKAQIKRLVL